MTISARNQYYWDILHSFFILSLWNPAYILYLQHILMGLATFQVLKGHLRLVAFSTEQHSSKQ